MKKSSVLIGITLFSMAGFLITGCSSDGGNEETTNTTTADSAAKKDIPEEVKNFYQIPAPNEIFFFIKENKGKAKGIEILNPADKLTKYVDTKSKSLNFGVYSADLLYCSIFDFGPQAVKYFVTVKKMGDDLGISSAINEDVMKRVQSNLGNNDTLTKITEDVFYSAYENLEQNDKGSSLALVVAGGWVEALYISTKINEKYVQDSPITNRIAEQKLSLDNLLEYLKKYESEEQISSTIKAMEDLKVVFDGIKQEESASSLTKNKAGKRVLGGGTKISITEDQYKQLVEKVAALRTIIIG
jgi:uncharacterized protein YneF (UPF0154 family)